MMPNPKHNIKEILIAKTSFEHFSIVFFCALVLSSFLYFFAIPLIYWIIFGEGEAAARIEEMSINLFIVNWGAIIITLLLCVTALAYNKTKSNFKHGKSYLITAIIISVLYIFRSQIGHLAIEIFF